MPGPLNPLGVQSSLAVTNAAVVSLTLPTGKGIWTSHALISVQTGDVRVRFDGGTPVAGAAGTAVGILYVAGSTISLMDPNFDYRVMLTGFRVIAVLQFDSQSL